MAVTTHAPTYPHPSLLSPSLPPSLPPSQVDPLPPGGINASQCCETCGEQKEPWVCLNCYHVRKGAVGLSQFCLNCYHVRKEAVGLSQLLPCKEESSLVPRERGWEESNKLESSSGYTLYNLLTQIQTHLPHIAILMWLETDHHMI